MTAKAVHRVKAYRVECECGMTLESTRDFGKMPAEQFTLWLMRFLNMHEVADDGGNVTLAELLAGQG